VTSFSELDRRIIEASQKGLPLTSMPYHALARQLGIDVRLVQQRFAHMLKEGVVRRIGAVPNHYRLGYRSNGMSVWDVDDSRIAELGPLVGELDFVSHAYHRPRRKPLWPYNLFAMVHGRSRDEVFRKVAMIEETLGNAQTQHEVLFSTRVLKKTGLRLSQDQAQTDQTQTDQAIAGT